LIWLTIINGLIAFFVFFVPWLYPAAAQAEGALPPEVTGLVMYFSMAVMGGSIGMIILAQDEIIQEKQSGTAAWILSKPAARQAFILTKLLSNIIGALVFIVVVPGLVALGEFFLATHQVMPLLPFLASLGVILLALVFYLSLVILLGVLFTSRGPVLGIALGIIFGGRIIANHVPQITYVLPVSMDGVALGVAQGAPLPAIFLAQLISSAVLSIVFVLAALWRFQRQEL
jgi:ABC-2 type transport system permease protein